MKQFFQTILLSPEKRKNEHPTEFFIFELIQVSNFYSELTILNFGTKFAQDRYLWLKNRKREHHHWILHIWISLSTRFQLELKTLSKKDFSVRKEQTWKWPSPLNSVYSIRSSLGTKFQLKLKILLFWIKFAKREYFRTKTENMSHTIEFCNVIWVSLGIKFYLQQTILSFCIKFAEKSISSEKQ